MSRTRPLQPFFTELRRMGFKRSYPNDRDCLIYTRMEPDGIRKLDLQLWRDGAHRVTHWIGGRETTVPTDFKTLGEMRAAIEDERRRMDNRNIPTDQQIPHSVILAPVAPPANV